MAGLSSRYCRTSPQRGNGLQTVSFQPYVVGARKGIPKSLSSPMFGEISGELSCEGLLKPFMLWMEGPTSSDNSSKSVDERLGNENQPKVFASGKLWGVQKLTWSGLNGASETDF